MGLLYLAVWVPAYAHHWGWPDFLYLCNVAVVLTCAGLWFGNSLLISSQAVGTALIGLLWGLNLVWAAFTHGRGLTGDFLGNLLPASNIEAVSSTRLFDL